MLLDFRYLLWALVLLCAVAGSTPLTINVSDAGVDQPSCLLENTSQSCHTLEYALRQIPLINTTADSIIVNVLTNQYLNTNQVNGSTEGFAVVIAGIGYPRPCINFGRFSTLYVVGSVTSITWKGLVIIGFSLNHFHVHTVTFLNCEIRLSDLVITRAQFVAINETTFGLGNRHQLDSCTFVSATVANAGITNSFIFSSNAISSCWLYNQLLSVESFSHIAIINNLFANIANRPFHHLSLAIFNSIIDCFLFRNNTFIGNDFKNPIEFAIFDSHGQIVVEQNHFLNNYNSLSCSLKTIFLIRLARASFLDVIFSENQYHNNSDLSIVQLQTYFDKPHPSDVVSVTMYSEILTNNTASLFSLQNCKSEPGVKLSQSSACFALVVLQGCTAINLSNITVTGNHVSISDNTLYGRNFRKDIYTSVFFLSFFFWISINSVERTAFLSDTVFHNNYGTPLIFWHAKERLDITSPLLLILSGNNQFVRNTALLGGALAVYNKDIKIVSNMSYLLFKENSALYGGAVFAQDTDFSVTAPCTLTVNFTDNNAVNGGESVYFATNPSKTVASMQCSNLTLSSTEGIQSYATKLYHILSANTTHQTIFPGQNTVINISITDYFDLPASCTADIYLMCDDRLLSCPGMYQQVTMRGPETVVLAQADNTNMTTIDTSHTLQSPEGPVNSSVSVLLRCRNINHTQVTIPLNITRCPLGFYYSQTDRTCKCVQVTNNANLFVCSLQHGTACVAHGYWYGEVTTSDGTTAHTVSKCSFPKCSRTFETCPREMLPVGVTSGFVRLQFNPDTQCSAGRGGVLCQSCAHGYVFAFAATNCVSETTCSLWQPILILLFIVMFQVTVAVLLFLLARFKFTFGCGFLYGPMLFLAIIHHLPMDDYSFLNTAISIVASIPLLNLQLFSLIPWCFFHPFGRSYIYIIHYLGPLIVLVVILLIFLTARWCPKTLRRFQSSPLQAMCILMLLSFWSLADISVNVLTPVVISYKTGSTAYVSIQPSIRYFSTEYIPVALPALLVLLVIIAPLVSVLLLSPLLSKVINLHRIKPFLDEFQSCYKDRFRWYSAVYFIVWIVLIICLAYSAMFAFQTILVGLLIAHLVTQPYNSVTLNTIDALLLTDINFLIGLIRCYPVSSIPTQLAMHALVIAPFVCAGVWLFYFIVIKRHYYRLRAALSRRQTCIQHEKEADGCQRLNVPVSELYFTDESGEREPLLACVSKN